MIRLTDLQKKIIDLLRESGEQQLTISQLTLQLGISRIDMYNYIRNMKQKGLIEKKTVASETNRPKLFIKLKEQFMNNAVTVPTDFNLQGHEIEKGAKIEIIRSSEKYFEEIGELTYRVKQDFDNGDISLTKGQVIRIIGKDSDE